MLEKSKQIKFVISHADTGIGDNLITLCAAYDYAVQYNVPLIIDWRNSRWLSHIRESVASPKDIPNLFEILFDNRHILGNVKIITDPKQIYEIIPNEELVDIFNVPCPLTGEIKILYTDDQEEVLPRNYDLEIKQERMMLIRSLKLSQAYVLKIDTFLFNYFLKDMVAIHIRLGNGEFGTVDETHMLMAAAEAKK